MNSLTTYIEGENLIYIGFINLDGFIRGDVLCVLKAPYKLPTFHLYPAPPPYSTVVVPAWHLEETYILHDFQQKFCLFNSADHAGSLRTIHIKMHS